MRLRIPVTDKKPFFYKFLFLQCSQKRIKYCGKQAIRKPFTTVDFKIQPLGARGENAGYFFFAVFLRLVYSDGSGPVRAMKGNYKLV